MTINVVVKPNTKYRLALYVLDWNQRDQRQAVEVLDLATLKLAAPIEMVRDFAEGKYLIYQCDRSVRLRINHVRNGNPVRQWTVLRSDPTIGGKFRAWPAP